MSSVLAGHRPFTRPLHLGHPPLGGTSILESTVERLFSPRLRIAGAFKRLPVTCILILIATFLYVLTGYLALFEPADLERTGFPGASTVLLIKKYPEVYGQFDLWRGEVWRLFFNVFHHAGPIHLLMNSVSLWFLAGMLEPRMGRVRFAMFFLSAGYASVLAQALIGDNPIGMSGAVYAVFGYLVAQRKYDYETAQRMSPMLVSMGFACLVIFVPLTAAGMIHVANLAHFVGLGYGWILAWLSCRTPRIASWKSRLGFAGLHLLIGIGTVAVIFPVWNGRYHAWKAFGLEQRSALAQWEKATSLSPDLAVAWLARAEIHHVRGELHDAWQTALQGLRINRTDEELDDFVHMMWQDWEAEPAECDLALTELRNIFDSESDAWIRRLKLTSPEPPGTPINIAEVLALLEEQAAELPRLDAQLDVPQDVAGITSPHPPALKPGEVDPDSPDSAMLGETL